MILVLILLDQFTKYFANVNQPNFNIIGHFLRIQYSENTGTIFGLFPNSNWLFLLLSMLLCVIIALYIHKSLSQKDGKRAGMILILAGGIGNLIDRIFRGFVVDFISLKWVGIFNLADSYVVIGVIIVLFIEFMELIQKKENSKDE